MFDFNYFTDIIFKQKMPFNFHDKQKNARESLQSPRRHNLFVEIAQRAVKGYSPECKRTPYHNGWLCEVYYT